MEAIFDFNMAASQFLASDRLFARLAFAFVGRRVGFQNGRHSEQVFNIISGSR